MLFYHGGSFFFVFCIFPLFSPCSSQWSFIQHIFKVWTHGIPPTSLCSYLQVMANILILDLIPSFSSEYHCYCFFHVSCQNKWVVTYGNILQLVLNYKCNSSVNIVSVGNKIADYYLSLLFIMLGNSDNSGLLFWL